MRIAPSILAADFAELGAAVDLCAEAGADLIHLDVMDGHFVPNLTFGPPVIAALARRSRLPLDVHLMVEDPDRLLDEYVRAGAARVAVHWEATRHLDRTLERITSLGAEAGVALNPATPVELLADILHRTRFVIVMSVNPGFSGQAFLPRALDKARRLRALAESRGVDLSITLDGGVGLGNAAQAARAGVDTLVAGAAVFGGADPRSAVAALRAAANGNGD